MSNNRNLPAVGDKVMILPWEFEGGDTTLHGIPEHYLTVVGTVTTASIGHDGYPTISAEFQSKMKPDDTELWSFRNWKPADGHTLTVSDPAPSEETGIITDLQAQVARLKEEATLREATIQRLQTAVSDWSHDFSVYAERIMQEAIDRNWCETYESVINDIRNDLRIAEIPDREQEYEVEVEITGEASVTRTVYVTARSQEDAEEMVSSDVSDYIDVEEILSEHVRYNGWDSTEADVQ